MGQNTYASSLCYDADGALYIFGYEAPKDVQNHKTNAIIYKKVGNSALQEFVTIDGWESLNERNSMASDGRGGLWVVSKFAGNDNHYANFFHINPNTTVDFNITTNGTTLSAKTIKGEMPANMPKNFDRGHVAYDAQHNVLALGGESKVALFRVTYDANNIPTLVYWTSTPTLGTNIDGIAFDYAGDLVVLSASTERFYKFAVPTNNNVCTTPAPTSQIIPHRFVLQDTKDNQAALASAIDSEVDALVCRSLTAGMFNTLCLPFNASLTDGPLAGAKAYTFSSSETEGGDILLHFTTAASIKAGVPYLIEPQTNIQGPIDFTNVTISVSEGDSTSSGNITFKGILAPKWLEANNKNILFLVSDNKLAWANANANMNGMRAYFSLPDGAYDQLRTRARIVTSESTTTDIQQTTTTSTNAQKLIRNGMLYILKDGQLYTVFGTKVK
jgi:predicted Fe-Mo cluster-binding NifX family protein